VEEIRDWMAERAPGSTHQGFPVIDEAGALVGVVTRRNLLDLDLPIDSRVGELVRQPPITIFEDDTARQAADRMVHEGIGRLPVVSRSEPRTVLGIVTRSDLLDAHARRLDAAHRAVRHIEFLPSSWLRRPPNVDGVG